MRDNFLLNNWHSFRSVYCLKMPDKILDIGRKNMRKTSDRLLRLNAYFFFLFKWESCTWVRLECTCFPLRDRSRHAFILTYLLAPCYDKTQNRFDVSPSTEAWMVQMNLLRGEHPFSSIWCRKSYTLVRTIVHISIRINKKEHVYCFNEEFLF